MPGNRRQGSNQDPRQKKLRTVGEEIVRIKDGLDDSMTLIDQYPRKREAHNFASLMGATRRLLTKIGSEQTQFHELQASSKVSKKERDYARQFDRVDKLLGLWKETLSNLNDLLVQSSLNDYTETFRGKRRRVVVVRTGDAMEISDYDKKDSVTRTLEITQKHVENIATIMNGLRKEQYAYRTKSLRQSLPSQDEKEPDTWVSAALLDSPLVSFIRDESIPSDSSWSLRQRNGFIEAVSSDSEGQSFAGTNHKCTIALTGLKPSSDTVAQVVGESVPASSKNQYYNSASTRDLEVRLASIADATEALLAESPAAEDVRRLRQSYLDKIRDLNLEELFEQLDREVGSNKRKRLSPKDWIIKSLFSDAKGWSSFYKENQRQRPALPKHKEIAGRIKQATHIMADYLREAQKIAAKKGQAFKIKEVARKETQLISQNNRSTFIALFDYEQNIFADCQIPIGTSTVPSSNRGGEHEGYANFTKTCLYRYQQGSAQLLFQGYRHSAAPPIDLKDEEEKREKTLTNVKTGLVQQFADTLQHRIDNGDLTLEDLQKNHADKDSALSISVASLSLLTPEYNFLKLLHDKGSNNTQLTMVANAFADLDGKPLAVTLKGGAILYVRPDICLMNAPTNHLGPIHYYSSEDFKAINQRGFAKLIDRIQKHLSGEKFKVEDDKIKDIKQKIEALLDARPSQRQACIDKAKESIDAFWEKVDDKTEPLLKEQCNFLQLAVEVIEIYSRGLRENVLNMLEFQASFMMINYMMGSIVEMYCKSGKDRTGAVDEMIKAKYLAQYETGASGRFFRYKPLIERAEEDANSATFKFIDGPLATIQRCGASPFSAGENTYGARNLQRNKFLAGFASGGETPIDLALAKLNKKPFSLADASIGKKAVMVLGGVLLLTPALMYWTGQFLNHRLIQRPIRFYRRNHGHATLKALTEETSDKLKTEEKRTRKGSSLDTTLSTIGTIASNTNKVSKEAHARKLRRSREAQVALRKTMDKALQTVEAQVGQVNIPASPSNDAFGKAQIVLTPLSDEQVKAKTFLNTSDAQKNISTLCDASWRESLTETCKDINRYFESLPSESHTEARVTFRDRHVLIGELFAKNTNKTQAKRLKSAADNHTNAYDKVQQSLVDLLVLSLPNSGITQDTQGAYGFQQSDGKFAPPTLQVTIRKDFQDTITLRHVLAIMLKVRELLERHNKSAGQATPVELIVTDQRQRGMSESISFSDKNGYQKIQKLASSGLGRLAAKADAREDQIKKAFDKFNLNLELASEKNENASSEAELQKRLLS